MNLQLILTIIVPLIERITQALQAIKPLAKVDSRITAAVIGIIVAFLLKIDLVAMAGGISWATLPVWLTIAISGYILSLGSNAVHWLFKQVQINLPKK